MKIKVKEIIIIMFLALIGGVLDTFCFKENFNTFCLIQTGNFIKIFVELINGNIELGLYSLMIFLVFILGIILFKVLNIYVFNKTILDKSFINSLILGLLLIPLIFLEFNSATIFNVNNVVNSICISLVGSLILVSFSNVGEINFASTMITNDTRLMGENLIEGIKEKDKTKLKKTLIYFGILLVFALGVISTALIIKFVDDTIRERLILLILFISIIVIIVLNFKIMKEKLWVNIA